MKASVILLTKNPGPIFAEVLAAVVEQNAPWPYEILVIDSGTCDGSIDCCKAAPNVKLHRIPAADFGHGRTRNLGISLSQGEYIVMLTHDAKPAHSHWLRELVASVEQQADIAGAFGRHLPYPGRNPFLTRDLQQHFDHFAQGPEIVRLDDPQRYETDIGYRQYLHFFSDNNACLRRSVWQKIPYPEVDFSEDQLWAKTIIEAGYAKAYADRASVYHSHEYSPWQTLRRSYDEARALRRLFGYQLGPSLPHLLIQIMRCSLRDYRYWFTHRAAQRYPEWLYKIPVQQLCQQMGYYLGTANAGQSANLDRMFSLDQAKRRQT